MSTLPQEYKKISIVFNLYDNFLKKKKKKKEKLLLVFQKGNSLCKTILRRIFNNTPKPFWGKFEKLDCLYKSQKIQRKLQKQGNR